MAVIDVLVDAAAFAQRVDEAAILGVIADRAHRDLVADRQVDHALEVAADVVLVDEVDVGFGQALEPAELRLVGDVADRAADRARAEQRALRRAASRRG